MRTYFLAFALAGLSVLAGCSDKDELIIPPMNEAGPMEDAGGDAMADDAMLPPAEDGSVGDASLPDASTPDASEPDASAPDASQPDASPPDASLPDASLPDASPADASVMLGCGATGRCMDRSKYCRFATPLSCGGPGICVERPMICTRIYRPVCGCDGRTHSNECVANSNGTDISSTGPCP